MITQKKCVCTLAAVFLFAGGCAPKNYSFEEEGAYDPLERINRGVYGVNKTIDAFLFRPLAQAYDKMPTVIKDRFDNFFYNLGEPSNIVNNTLQKQINAAAWSASRLVFNTTLGVGGLFDVSDKMGIKTPAGRFWANYPRLRRQRRRLSGLALWWGLRLWLMRRDWWWMARCRRFFMSKSAPLPTAPTVSTLFAYAPLI